MSEIKKALMEMVEDIDLVLGEGYARKNPDLIGKLMHGCLVVTAANAIQDGLYFLGSDPEEYVQ